MLDFVQEVVVEGCFVALTAPTTVPWDLCWVLEVCFVALTVSTTVSLLDLSWVGEVPLVGVSALTLR